MEKRKAALSLFAAAGLGLPVASSISSSADSSTTLELLASETTAPESAAPTAELVLPTPQAPSPSIAGNEPAPGATVDLDDQAAIRAAYEAAVSAIRTPVSTDASSSRPAPSPTTTAPTPTTAPPTSAPAVTTPTEEAPAAPVTASDAPPVVEAETEVDKFALYAAFWNAGYNYNQLLALAAEWQLGEFEAKARAGQLILAGDTSTIDAIVAGIPPTEFEAEFGGDEPAPVSPIAPFLDAGYSYDDALELAADWNVDPFEAKIRASELISNGQAGEVDAALAS